MKNPVNIAKKGYNKILQIEDLTQKLDRLTQKIDGLTQKLDGLTQKQDLLNDKINHTISLLENLSQTSDHHYENLNNTLLTEYKTNSLRFNALYKKPQESIADANKRFFENMSTTSEKLRTFQLGNTKLLQKFINICKENNLPYFAQSGTLLGAVRHQGFVPWDDDTDVAMFREDIIKLRNILKNDNDYKLALVYDYFVKSRQLRFRTTDPENPCFIDVYIYDYGNDDSDEAWRKWHETKVAISNKLEKEDPALIEKWRKTGYVEEESPLGKKLKPLFKKYYDPLLDSKLNKDNYTTINWALDNFPVKWKRLFKKDFIFPTILLTYEGLKIAAPGHYEEYLERQYGNIYELPKDLVAHFQHIDQENINIAAINKFLNKDN